MFEIMIWVGAAISMLGLTGLVWCIIRVAKARRAGLSEEELRAEVQAVMPLNLGALFLSVIGLMFVVIGVMLA